MHRMSNAAYHDFVHRVLDRAHITGREILRIGSAHLEPSLRLIAKAYGAVSYVGVDFELGPNGGKTCRVEDLLAKFGPESFDLLICSELLQHVDDWRAAIAVFKRIIRPHGSILITTRSLALPTPPFPHALIDLPHGAMQPAPECADPEKASIFGEPRADTSKPHWRYELSDMEALFSDFEIATLEADPSEPGVFLLAKKPEDFQERDLWEWPLFSVTANRRVTTKQRKPPGSLEGEAKSLHHLFDEFYFDFYEATCRLPYRRTEEWLKFFATIADRIVQEINPQTVLDAGCAKGFLVEAFRDRGVEAFGLDISEYAISQCREDIRPYCWVASAVDPFPRRYDLIVCIEVLEHLPKQDAEIAVVNLCKHADDILFSSTPDDFTECTHINVQPFEYWAGLFAKQGFYRDADFDASFIAVQATRFRKVTGPVHSVIRAYERRLWAQLREVHALRQFHYEVTVGKHKLEGQLAEAAKGQQRLEAELRAAAEQTQRLDTLLNEAAQETPRLKREVEERDAKVERLQASMEAKDSRIDHLAAELREIQSGLGWMLLSAYSRAKNRWLSPGSKIRALYDAIVSGVKLGLSRGFGALFRKIAARLRRHHANDSR